MGWRRHRGAHVTVNGHNKVVIAASTPHGPPGVDGRHAGMFATHWAGSVTTCRGWR